MASSSCLIGAAAFEAKEALVRKKRLIKDRIGGRDGNEDDGDTW
jgi:hypothetical protein